MSFALMPLIDDVIENERIIVFIVVVVLPLPPRGGATPPFLRV